MAGCTVCTSGSVDQGTSPGCKNNGTCGTGGCNKLNVFDWLSNMDLPAVDVFPVVEVRFKGGRKEFYENTDRLDLITGDSVIVDVQGGHHMGFVSLQGELVRLQMQKKKVKYDHEIRKIYRVATSADLDKYHKVKERELPTMYRSRLIIKELGLKMKMTDVEYQADNSKATFYYSSEGRVDFRELIKHLAKEFRVRVEMRQISLRQEASRLGGIGACGRELCCSTWLTDFKTVTTAAARYQNLSLNPSKLSGQCGRLKCCLNFELDTYKEALSDIPKINQNLQFEKGKAYLQKTDIFRKIMWFSFADDHLWHPLSIEEVITIQKQNAAGEIPRFYSSIEAELEEKASEEVVSANPVESDLDKLDRKYGKGKQRNKGKKKGSKKFAKAVKGDGQKSGEKPSRNSRNRNKKKSKDGAMATAPFASDTTDAKVGTSGAKRKPRKKKRKPSNRENAALKSTADNTKPVGEALQGQAVGDVPKGTAGKPRRKKRRSSKNKGKLPTDNQEQSSSTNNLPKE